MTAHKAGASTTKQCWNHIDADAMQRLVERLQMRIAKAVKAKKYGKARALQHLLSRSFAAKFIAVKRVTENKGGRTPGIDKVLWSTPQAKLNAVLSLKARGYKHSLYGESIFPNPTAKSAH